MRPKLSSKGSQGMTMSQERSTRRHLESYMLRGQNEGSTTLNLNLMRYNGVSIENTYCH